MNMCICIYALSKTDFLLRSGIFIFLHKTKASVKAEPEETEIRADDTQVQNDFKCYIRKIKKLLRNFIKRN